MWYQIQQTACQKGRKKRVKNSRENHCHPSVAISILKPALSRKQHQSLYTLGRKNLSKIAKLSYRTNKTTHNNRGKTVNQIDAPAGTRICLLAPTVGAATNFFLTNAPYDLTSSCSYLSHGM